MLAVDVKKSLRPASVASSASRHRPTPDNSPSPSHPAASKRRRTLPTLVTSARSLVDLTPALLVLISQYLPWRHKLLHLSHLAHAYPRLAPLWLANDHVPIKPALLRALASSARVSSLFSETSFASLSSALVGAALYGETSDLLQPPLPACSRPLLSHFASLHSLVMMLDEPEDNDPTDDVPGFHERLFATLASATPHLNTLHFETERKRYPPQVMSTQSLSLLRLLPHMRTLRLGFLILEHSAVAMLCSLPAVSYLDIGGCLVLHPQQCPWKETPAQQFAPSRTLNSLFLPRHETSNISAVLDVLNRCGDASKPPQKSPPFAPDEDATTRGYDGLDYLAMDVRSAHLVLPLLPFIQSLISIDLDGSDAFDLTPLCSDGTAALPKLSEFRASSVMPMEWEDEWLQTLCSSYLRFVAAYKEQIRALDLRVPNAGGCLRVVQACFDCPELRLLDLSITPKDQEPLFDCSTLTPSPLPHLHTLAVNVLHTDAQLRRFLPFMPAMEDLALFTLDVPSLDTLEAIGVACPEVRRVRITIDAERADEKGEIVAWTSSTPPAFLSLGQLTIVHRVKDTAAMSNVDAVSLAQLLLHHAPVLRYLRLAVDLEPSLAFLLCDLPALSALRPRSLRPSYASFFVQASSVVGVQDEWGKAEAVGKFAGFTLGSGVLDAACMAEEQREEFNGYMLVRERRFANGADGKEAMRRAIIHFDDDPT